MTDCQIRVTSSLAFKPLELSDKPLFDRYVSHSGLQHCDIAFANLYLYRTYWNPEWVEHQGFLLIRFRIGRYRRLGYPEPVGSGDWIPLVELMEADAAAQGEPLRLFNLSEENAQRLRESPRGGCLHLYQNRDYADYLYTHESLATLRGSHLQPKRNHFNKFTKLYRYHTEPLTAAHAQQVLALVHRWAAEKEERGDAIEFDMAHEETIIRDSFAHFDALALRGLMLYVDQTPVAFTFGSELTPDTFVVHIEKADTSYEGAFTAINRLFVESLPEHYRYINREDDLGLPGLRRSKLSYDPLRVIELWHAVARNSEEGRIWQLWLRCFPGESDAFISYYLFHYSQPATRLLHYEEDRLAGMIHFHTFRTDLGAVAYFYALGVDPDFREQGFAQQLVCAMFRRHREEGAVLGCCIPASSELAQWYTATFDMMPNPGEASIYLCTPDHFDLGTGSSEQDHALWRILSAPRYLQRYAVLHPEEQREVILRDELLPQNDGRYEIAHGTVHFTPGSFDGASTPAELYAACPLFDSELIFEK